MLNVRAEVIGINTAILSNGFTRGNVGVGFAIPIDAISGLLPTVLLLLWREGQELFTTLLKP